MPSDILIVDDEDDIRHLVAELLRDEGYTARTARNSDEALAEVAARLPDMVLLDIWLDGSRLDGMGILSEIVRDHPGLPVVMFSGHGTIETAVTAIREGAYDFIEKPFKSDRLLLVVRNAIEHAKLRREVADLKKRTGADAPLPTCRSARRHRRYAS